MDPLSHDAKTGLVGALVLRDDIDSVIKVFTDAAGATPYPQRAYYELAKTLIRHMNLKVKKINQLRRLLKGGFFLP